MKRMQTSVKHRTVAIAISLLLSLITLTACTPGLVQDPVSGTGDMSSENQSSAAGSLEPEQPDDVKVEISMEDAIALGEQEAVKYYDNLRLTEVHSYDNDYAPDIHAGENGKREWWYVNFANEELNYVNILIQNGKIVDVHHYDENGNNGLFDMADVKITSEVAVQRAKELGMRGGNPENEQEWVSGYNFKLSKESLAENPDDVRLFFEVIGISPNGNFAHVDLDAATGELIQAIEKIEYENGDAEWIPFQKTLSGGGENINL